jgi:hypothetical protein
MKPKVPLPGWIILFAIVQTSGAGWRMWHVAQAVSILWRVRHATGAAGDIVRGYASTRAVLTTILIALGIAGVAKIVRRGRDTRRYWVVCMPVMICISGVLISMTWTEAHALSSALGHEVSSEVVTPRVIGAYLVALAWWLYWVRSRRIRETFEPTPSWPGFEYAEAPEPVAETTAVESC